VLHCTMANCPIRGRIGEDSRKKRAFVVQARASAREPPYNQPLGLANFPILLHWSASRIIFSAAASRSFVPPKKLNFLFANPESHLPSHSLRAPLSIAGHISKPSSTRQHILTADCWLLTADYTPSCPSSRAYFTRLESFRLARLFAAASQRSTVAPNLPSRKERHDWYHWQSNSPSPRAAVVAVPFPGFRFISRPYHLLSFK
jgi:hypothetical protein